MFAAQHYRWRHPRTLITSGGLGTMGFGLPAAIGAKVARPEALVIDIDGDSSFNMTLTELSTAFQYGLDIKVLLLNNSEMGMVTQWQGLFCNGRYSHSHLRNPDFVALAQAMGFQAQKCTRPVEVQRGLEWLVHSNGPALLEVVTDSKVALLPMVPPGSALHEFIVYDKGMSSLFVSTLEGCRGTNKFLASRKIIMGKGNMIKFQKALWKGWAKYPDDNSESP